MATAPGPIAPTQLVYQHDSKCYSLHTKIVAVVSFVALEPENQLLFKQGAAGDYALITSATIFHPQGGGQPSDVGTMFLADGGNSGEGDNRSDCKLDAGPSSEAVVFTVALARMDAVNAGRVLHFGRFGKDDKNGTSTSPPPLAPGQTVCQAIDSDKRLLYSRLHTAGHVLGAAVRHLLEVEIPDFDELKASHVPGASACEFRGRIEAHWREPIQKRVDDYVTQAMPVVIDWWDAAEFRHHGLERLWPATLPAEATENGKLRVVRIVGAEIYPCGGTHVDSTDLCGATRVTKISRSKGISRVSYTVA
ncbi:hypothetical protein SPI_07506 [Niveomyces insectorum RCEF 264]|uniref:Alanyl-transfer RNA synthetases family profile domain-containing protein n=1 Tax=Niveomyces insectorum RCEF 264 TaxID=1081102 RepID=A0A162IH87_9HYPO|nr:hypothetical protein SPI_07506 [Niveomyces insectorum RCEF 264]